MADVTIDQLAQLAPPSINSGLMLPVSTGTVTASIFLGDAFTELSPVKSVFGRTGSVTLQSSDVTGALGYTPSRLTQAAAVNTTSGTSFAFTGIPSWAKRITVMFANISTTGTSEFNIRLGTSTGYASSNYNSMRGGLNNTGIAFNRVTDRFALGGQTATNFSSGSFILTNLTANTWTGIGNSGDTSTLANFIAGHCILPSTLDSLQFYITSGTFDSGVLNIMYEG
jgi:hypothetical protein